MMIFHRRTLTPERAGGLLVGADRQGVAAQEASLHEEGRQDREDQEDHDGGHAQDRLTGGVAL